MAGSSMHRYAELLSAEQQESVRRIPERKKQDDGQVLAETPGISAQAHRTLKPAVGGATTGRGLFLPQPEQQQTYGKHAGNEGQQEHGPQLVVEEESAGRWPPSGPTMAPAWSMARWKP